MPPAEQLVRSDAEAHYVNLLAYFKHLVWLTGAALTIVVIVGGYFFHSNLQDSLRDVRENAKSEAIRVATEESREAVGKAFEEEHVRKLVEEVAKGKIAAVTDQMIGEKVGPIADKTIEQRLTSKLQPIEENIVLIGKISEDEARIHMGSRSALVEVTGIAHNTRDVHVREFAESTLTATAKAYEEFWQNDIKRIAPSTALSQLDIGIKMSAPGAGQTKGLPDVVAAINQNQDLNIVAVAFLAFTELTGEHLKMFDFEAVQSWCAKHQGKCQ